MPVLSAIPFAFCLVGARVVFVDSPLGALLAGGAGGGSILTWLYWRTVLPQSLKKRIVGRLTRRRMNPAPQSI